jgi:hypothetical protein
MPCVLVQVTLLEASLSRSMAISLSKFSRVPMSALATALSNFDVDSLGGYDGVQLLLDLNCYDAMTQRTVAGERRVRRMSVLCRSASPSVTRRYVTRLCIASLFTGWCQR